MNYYEIYIYIFFFCKSLLFLFFRNCTYYVIMCHYFFLVTVQDSLYLNFNGLLGCYYIHILFEMWSDGHKVRCRQILHCGASGGLRPIKSVIITIPVNFAPGKRDSLQAELNNDYLPRPINCRKTIVGLHRTIFRLTIAC